MAERGRPQRDSISRFNIATDLTSNSRFIEFRLTLGADEPTAFLVVSRFFNFVAANRAVSANLQEIKPAVLAAFCYWKGEPEQLINALREAGFLESDNKVHDWFGNQPMAADLARKRGILPNSSENNSEEFAGNRPKREDKSEDKRERETNTAKISDASRAHARAAGQNVDNQPGNTSIVSSPVPKNPDLDRRILDFIHELETIVSLNGNDKAGIFDDLRAHGKPDELNWTLDQLRMAKADGRLGTSPGIANPIGWIRKKIQSHAPG